MQTWASPKGEEGDPALHCSRCTLPPIAKVTSVDKRYQVCQTKGALKSSEVTKVSLMLNHTLSTGLCFIFNGFSTENKHDTTWRTASVPSYTNQGLKLAMKQSTHHRKEFLKSAKTQILRGNLSSIHSGPMLRHPQTIDRQFKGKKHDSTEKVMLRDEET
ncbi:hypothetical protein P7K49_026476 [Saguinus oedipus]|uniref:Uncharacterized protein n=1 Tax=Saguinus oedipus TaxID=9490 RepID=A0ABQ9UDH3_SAGOE|nr:hypothetical protein P7K49_026476 [Saguinus oedipus]